MLNVNSLHSSQPNFSQLNHNPALSLENCKSVKHFRHLLESQHFAIFPDHKPLTTAMYNSSDKYTAREIRHLDYISQFTTDLRRIKGENNTVADTLSKIELSTLNKDILNQDLIADRQKSDSTLQGVLTDTSLALQ